MQNDCVDEFNDESHVPYTFANWLKQKLEGVASLASSTLIGIVASRITLRVQILRLVFYYGSIGKGRVCIHMTHPWRCRFCLYESDVIVALVQESQILS